MADYTHAGAIGFPPVASLDADIVGGDPEKWLLPPSHGSRLAFLWMRSAALFRTAARLFSPCFLAIDGAVDSRAARWIDPAALAETTKWLAAAGLTRRALLDRHQANLQMKRRLARRLGIPPGDDTSVLWIEPADSESARHAADPPGSGLAWGRRPHAGSCAAAIRNHRAHRAEIEELTTRHKEPNEGL